MELRLLYYNLGRLIAGHYGRSKDFLDGFIGRVKHSEVSAFLSLRSYAKNSLTIPREFGSPIIIRTDLSIKPTRLVSRSTSISSVMLSDITYMRALIFERRAITIAAYLNASAGAGFDYARKVRINTSLSPSANPNIAKQGVSNIKVNLTSNTSPSALRSRSVSTNIDLSFDTRPTVGTAYSLESMPIWGGDIQLSGSNIWNKNGDYWKYHFWGRIQPKSYLLYARFPPLVSIDSTEDGKTFLMAGAYNPTGSWVNVPYANTKFGRSTHYKIESQAPYGRIWIQRDGELIKDFGIKPGIGFRNNAKISGNGDRVVYFESPAYQSPYAHEKLYLSKWEKRLVQGSWTWQERTCELPYDLEVQTQDHNILPFQCLNFTPNGEWMILTGWDCGSKYGMWVMPFAFENDKFSDGVFLEHPDNGLDTAEEMREVVHTWRTETAISSFEDQKVILTSQYSRNGDHTKDYIFYYIYNEETETWDRSEKIFASMPKDYAPPDGHGQMFNVSSNGRYIVYTASRSSTVIAEIPDPSESLVPITKYTFDFTYSFDTGTSLWINGQNKAFRQGYGSDNPSTSNYSTPTGTAHYDTNAGQMRLTRLGPNGIWVANDGERFIGKIQGNDGIARDSNGNIISAGAGYKTNRTRTNGVSIYEWRMENDQPQYRLLLAHRQGNRYTGYVQGPSRYANPFQSQAEYLVPTAFKQYSNGDPFIVTSSFDQIISNSWKYYQSSFDVLKTTPGLIFDDWVDYEAFDTNTREQSYEPEYPLLFHESDEQYTVNVIAEHGDAVATCIGKMGSGDGSDGSISGNGTNQLVCKVSAQVQFTQTPHTGYEFTGWTFNEPIPIGYKGRPVAMNMNLHPYTGGSYSSTGNRSNWIYMPPSDITVTANYSQIN